MMNTPVPCQTRKSSRRVEVPPRLSENLSTVLLVTRLQEVITSFHFQTAFILTLAAQSLLSKINFSNSGQN